MTKIKNPMPEWLERQLKIAEESVSQWSEEKQLRFANRLSNAFLDKPDKIPEWLKEELGIDEDTVEDWSLHLKNRRANKRLKALLDSFIASGRGN